MRSLPWVRLDRDWHSTPSMLEICEQHPAAEVLAAYAITLAEAARSDGVYQSAASLERAIRTYARLRPQRATAIVAAFISTGILSESDGSLQLNAWEDLQPKDRHLTKTQRRATIVTPIVTPIVTALDTESVEHNTTDELTNTTPQASATVGVEWIDADTVRLPPKVEPIPRTHCSHGERFTEKRRSSDGSLFISSGHRLDDGRWCGEAPL